jgi:hypothetical protein
VVAVLEQTMDDEQIIERVGALDIGKAEVMCCVRPRSVSSAVRDGVLNEQMPCQLRRISVAKHGFGPY